jgi:predicted NAD-dependent protein-ADP-ribosyltransferase YbiA (DUF1768 family)
MTTVSIINPEVTYRESKTIDDEDIGYQSQVYELDLDHTAAIDPENPTEKSTQKTAISVAIGKPKYIYTDKNIIFFPIYAVRRSEVRSQIGVFEVKSTQLLNVFKSGELDSKRLSPPLYYSFATSDYLAKLEADPKLFKEKPTTNNVTTVEKISILEKERDDDYLALNIGKTALSKAHTDAKDLLEKGAFEDVDGFAKKPPLDEESKEVADEQRKEYKESSRAFWIEKYMRNSNYRIHSVENNGDCLFAVIRDAFADIGKKTTVEKLRAILATEMTDDIFDGYRKVYLSFLDEIQTLKRDLAAVDKTIKEYKKRIKQITDKTTADGKALVVKSRELETEKKYIERKLEETNQNKTLYTGNMDGIDTLEKMRDHIKKSAYWADTWAISTLERVLNVKLVIFSKQAFEQDEGAPDLDGVILCGEASKELQERQTFSPDYYIFASYSGDHYELISYKSRKIFQFNEMPYDVKILILNKCLSRLSGVYYMIQDFRNLKTRFGIDEDEGAPLNYADLEGTGELFNPAIAFVFCSNSDPKMKPGEGNGEKITAAEKSKYAQLNTKYHSWRKKLDDDWDKTQIIIDGHKWTSVTHYMKGVQYKRTHPDVYMMFSLDSDPESTLAKSVKTAKAFKGVVKEAGDTENPQAEEDKKKPKKAAKKQVRVIAPDLDFDEKRREEERSNALKSKFHNNETMRLLLKATGDALLIHKCDSGEPAVPDLELMRVRSEIRE